MAQITRVSTTQKALLWSAIALYIFGRFCQQYPEKVSTIGIVVLQVLAPALFAVIHGSILYRVRGMLAFTVFCIGAGGIFESLSLRTGFPFGHYYFTGLMGPEVLGLPILLVLAYLGIGYCSWVVALLILGYRDKPITGSRVIAAPFVAGLVMVAWDLSMDPIWSTLDRAWIWRDGGAFYGVPISNFLGWFLVAFVFYLAFALYLRANPIAQPPDSRSYWRSAIVVYAVCACGNLLVFRPGLFPASATDPSGRPWMAIDILHASVLVSLLIMTPMALLAWLRLRKSETKPQAV